MTAALRVGGRIVGLCDAPASGGPLRFAPRSSTWGDVLGDQTYESLARQGETMTTAAMVTYAFDQIDQARAELEHSG